MIRKAVIPAAGVGSRFLPASRCVPKEMFPIWDRPVIAYVVEEAFDAGVSEVVIVTSPMKPTIEDYFEDDPRVSFVYQLEPKGLGDALLCAEDVVGDDDLMVLLPDVLLEHPIESEIYAGAVGLVGVTWVPRERIRDYGIVVTDGGGRVVSAVEKPEVSESRLALAGRYSFSNVLFDRLRQAGGDLTKAIDLMASSSLDGIRACAHLGRVFDVGTPSGMAGAWRYFSEEIHYERTQKDSRQAASGF